MIENLINQADQAPTQGDRNLTPITDRKTVNAMFTVAIIGTAALAKISHEAKMELVSHGVIGLAAPKRADADPTTRASRAIYDIHTAGGKLLRFTVDTYSVEGDAPELPYQGDDPQTQTAQPDQQDNARTRNHTSWGGFPEGERNLPV